MKFILLDLDNCISDDGWRIPHINFQKKGDARYHTYHTLSPFDRAKNFWTVTEALRCNQSIIIMTGRPVEFAEATKKWLNNLSIPVHAMMMRNAGDVRPAAELKLWQLDQLLSNPEYGVGGLRDIAAAYDDHPQVIHEYQRAGIHWAKRVCIHTIDAYVNPATGERHE